MTVTVLAKHADVSKSDDTDNETCCLDKVCEIHAQSFLETLQNDLRMTYDQENDQSKPEVSADIKSYKTIVCFEDAPDYMKHNVFIKKGYRNILNTQLCLESVFWWTNETINIWSHIFGLILFISLAIHDILFLKVHASICDEVIIGSVLICFQICMFLSALYHTFSCRSKEHCDLFLSFDLFGIALSLLAIYTSGVYYAFWCEQELRNFYMFTVTAIFIVAMCFQIPYFNVPPTIKMLVFVAWAAYGVLPTLHWTIAMGGFENPLVRLLFPRVIGMYVIGGTAFFIYVTKIPERFWSGKFDFLGHSHQWWHFFVVIALLYWHNSGMLYVDYRLNHACYNDNRFSIH